MACIDILSLPLLKYTPGDLRLGLKNSSPRIMVTFWPPGAPSNVLSAPPR